MSYRKLLTLLVAASGLTAMAQTTTTTTHAFDFPPVGLGATETARINLTNIATASNSGTAASCTVSVSFVNAAGTTIGTASSLTIASGVTSSASLAFSNSGLTGVRGTIRGVIAQSRTTTSGTSSAPCSLLFSMETFDTASGATHLLLTAAEEATTVSRGH